MAFYATNNYEPVKVMRNNILVGGYREVTVSIPATVEKTYRDLISFDMKGTVEQDGIPLPNNVIEPIFGGGVLKIVDSNALNEMMEYDLPTLRAIPDGAGGLSTWDELTHVGNGQYDLTRRVGVRTFDGTENIVWYDIGNTQYYSPYFAVECDAAFTSRTICLCNCLPGRERVSISIKDNNCVGVAEELVALNGKPGIMLRSEAFENNNIDAVRAFLKERAANGTPFTVWYQLAEAQVERVTLGEIKSFSKGTSLTVDGKLMPKCEATLKTYQ